MWSGYRETTIDSAVPQNCYHSWAQRDRRASDYWNPGKASPVRGPRCEKLQPMTKDAASLRSLEREPVEYIPLFTHFLSSNFLPGSPLAKPNWKSTGKRDP